MINTEKIGQIEADSRKDPLAKQVITAGFWRASGLLSEVVLALAQLEESLILYGHIESEFTYSAVKKARIRLFFALREIGLAANETATPDGKPS